MRVLRHVLVVLTLLFAMSREVAAAHALPHDTTDARQRPAQAANSGGGWPVARPLRLIELGGRVGVASPVGMFGVELSINLRGWLSLRLGAGGGPVGPQMSALAALRLPLGGRYAIGVGTGLSVGAYDQSWLVTPNGSGTNYGMITWWNSELYLEARADRFAFRPFVGVGVALNGDREDCYEGECETIRVERLPLIGVAMAWELGN